MSEGSEAVAERRELLATAGVLYKRGNREGIERGKGSDLRVSGAATRGEPERRH